jgi:hypothetical protein
VEHLRFKSEMTAAAYVAGKLEPELQSAFELHMMSCADCVGEVETWRALKGNLEPEFPQVQVQRAAAPDGVPSRIEPVVAPPAASRPARVCGTAAGEREASPSAKAAQAPKAAAPAAAKRSATGTNWRVALTVTVVGIAGAAGGWFARAMQGPDTDAVGFYSLPALVRGPTDCTTARLGPSIHTVVVRVPGAARGQQLVAVDNEGHDLAPERYSVRGQGDGSWLAQLAAGALREREIRFEARSVDGTVEPRGCLIDSAAE